MPAPNTTNNTDINYFNPILHREDENNLDYDPSDLFGSLPPMPPRLSERDRQLTIMPTRGSQTSAPTARIVTSEPVPGRIFGSRLPGFGEPIPVGPDRQSTNMPSRYGPSEVDLDYVNDDDDGEGEDHNKTNSYEDGRQAGGKTRNKKRKRSKKSNKRRKTRRNKKRHSKRHRR